LGGFVFEHVSQELEDSVFWVQSAPAEDLFQLAAIEPKSVVSFAPVDGQWGVTLSYEDLGHPLVTNRAPAGSLGRSGVLAKRTKELICLFGGVHQQFQFAPIKPDAATTDAVINLHVAHLQRYHGFLA